MLADLVISEATAADVLPRHVARLVQAGEGPMSRADTAGLRIELAGSNHDLCRALLDACEGAGYRALPVGELRNGAVTIPAASPSAPSERVLTIWDVPILEPDWSQGLEQRLPIKRARDRADRLRRPRNRDAGENKWSDRVPGAALQRRRLDRRHRPAPPDHFPSRAGRYRCGPSSRISYRRRHAGGKGSPNGPRRQYRGQIAAKSLKWLVISPRGVDWPRNEASPR